MCLIRAIILLFIFIMIIVGGIGSWVEKTAKEVNTTKAAASTQEAGR